MSPEYIEAHEVWIGTDSGSPDAFGFFALCEDAPGAVLDHFWIEPSRVRTGLGREMFAEVLRVAERRAWPRIVLYADPPSEGFYLALGFRQIGEKASRIAGGPIFPVLEIDRRSRTGQNGGDADPSPEY